MFFICTDCRQRVDEPPKPVWLCPCGRPFSVHYEWEEIKRAVDVDTNENSMWRYESVLPPVNKRVTLGEGKTPLVSIGNNTYVKDETVNPTGSFKDRGMSTAISMAEAQGVSDICLPSAGNAGIAAAAYCQESGIECHVFYRKQSRSHSRKKQKSMKPIFI